MEKFTAKIFLETLKEEPRAKETHKYLLKVYDKYPKATEEGVQHFIDISKTDEEFAMKIVTFEFSMKEYYEGK